LISVPAGFEDMPWVKFLLYSVIGTVCWNILLTYAGYVLGQNYQVIEKFLGPISGIVLAGLVLFFGIWIVKRKHKGK
jgi:membrane protein DedA with SNARE-associated domain